MDIIDRQQPTTYSKELGGPQKQLRDVSALVARLMNHYWKDNEHAAMRQAQIEDWITDLREFPVECIEEACREWRRTETKRPTPAHIRKLAIAARAAAAQERAQAGGGQVVPPGMHVLSDDELRERLHVWYGHRNWTRCWVGEPPNLRLIINRPADESPPPLEHRYLSGAEDRAKRCREMIGRTAAAMSMPDAE